MLEEVTQDISEPVYIFNPTKSDFTCTYDVPNSGITSFTLKAYEGARFPRYLAEHIAKHLKNKIVGEMEGVITDTVVEDVYKRIKLYD